MKRNELNFNLLNNPNRLHTNTKIMQNKQTIKKQKQKQTQTE